MEPLKFIECPRDAWQGLPDFIPTETKSNYLRELVMAGFKHIDAHRIIPSLYQRADVYMELILV